jgi:hypothetical protein
MKIKELFDHRSKWTQLAYARDNQGMPCKVQSDDTVSWCMIGAINLCYPEYEANKHITSRVTDYIAESNYPSENRSIMVWNDYEKREYQEVIDLITDLNI